MGINKNNEHDSLKDVIEFQNNLYNPGHYVGTGKIPPTVSAPGNATPLAILCFFASAVFGAFGLFLFFSNINVRSGLTESLFANKLIALIIMLVIALFFLFMGFVYVRKARRYFREKSRLEEETIDETIEDIIAQRTCPNCGANHDMDYPKCPKCKYNYLK